LLNVTDDFSSWALGILPSDKPVFKPVRVEEMAITLKALRNRADLESARLEVEKQKIRLKRARRNLLPQLDLEGSAASLAVDNNTTNSLNRLSGNKSYSISGGITFRIPLGNRDAKADLANVKLQTQQALVRYNKTEQDIMEQIRRAVRRLRSDRKRIEVTRIARRLTEERLDAQEKKFKVGLSTSRDILEDQEKLANALSNETRALVDYNKSQANLDLATHSTLKRFRVTLSDPRKGPQKGKP
ncbi:MAG: TolC family protein, partial [bacterium]